ncbi:farnesol dehydrogenase-like [Cochliomyia hominivorax]
MERWQNRVAVVTGASSGIGAAIIKDLVAAGLIVVGLARRKERVDEIRAKLPAKLQSRLHPYKCDVSNLQSVNEAFDWIEKNLGTIEILINNAGTYTPGQILTMDIETVQQTLQTNVMGIVYCTRRAFQSMQKANVESGHVILINSIVGHYIFNPPPGVVTDFNVYPPTKHAVTGLTEILRQEFRDLKTKIKITSVSPGLVDTEIVPDRYKALKILNPEDISAGVMYCLSTPPHVQVHELTIKPLGEVF